MTTRVTGVSSNRYKRQINRDDNTTEKNKRLKPKKSSKNKTAQRETNRPVSAKHLSGSHQRKVSVKAKVNDALQKNKEAESTSKAQDISVHRIDKQKGDVGTKLLQVSTINDAANKRNKDIKTEANKPRGTEQAVDTAEGKDTPIKAYSSEGNQETARRGSRQNPYSYEDLSKPHPPLVTKEIPEAYYRDRQEQLWKLEYKNRVEGSTKGSYSNQWIAVDEKDEDKQSVNKNESVNSENKPDETNGASKPSGPFLNGSNTPRVAVVDGFGYPGLGDIHGKGVRHNIESVYGEDGEAIKIDEFTTGAGLEKVVKQAEESGPYDAVNLSYSLNMTEGTTQDSSYTFTRQLHHQMFHDASRESDPDQYTSKEKRAMAEALIEYGKGDMKQDNELYPFLESWNKYGKLEKIGADLEAGKQLMKDGTEIFMAAGNEPNHVNMFSYLTGYDEFPGKAHVVAAAPMTDGYATDGSYKDNVQKVIEPVVAYDDRMKKSQSEHFVTDIARAVHENSTHEHRIKQIHPLYFESLRAQVNALIPADQPEERQARLERVVKSSVSSSSYASPVALASFLREKAENGGVEVPSRTYNEIYEKNTRDKEQGYPDIKVIGTDESTTPSVIPPPSPEEAKEFVEEQKRRWGIGN